MELVLDRKIADRRVYPAIDLMRSGTRKEELLLSEEELNVCGFSEIPCHDVTK
jgi:transcription termination factor Rho